MKNICIKKYQKQLGLYYFNSFMPGNAQFNRSSIGQDLNLELLATELPKETFIYQHNWHCCIVMLQILKMRKKKFGDIYFYLLFWGGGIISFFIDLFKRKLWYFNRKMQTVWAGFLVLRYCLIQCNKLRRTFGS